MMKALVFYDADCGFCQRSVLFLAHIDHKRKLLFAPLNSSIAQEYLRGLTLPDGVVFYLEKEERFHIWTEATAIFQIFSLVGRGWKIAALFRFFPKMSRFFYRLVARHRAQLGVSKKKPWPPSSDARFIK